MPSSAMHIRPATREDTSLILTFIRKLAVYEKLEDEVITDEETLASCLFGSTPRAHVLIAEMDGRPAGFALYFFNFSTFLGRPGLYVEDVYVDEDRRGYGIGKQLFARMAQIALQEGCGRMEWAVLDWNTPSIDFYKKMGAEAMDEWTIYRLTGEPLDQLAEAEH